MYSRISDSPALNSSKLVRVDSTHIYGAGGAGMVQAGLIADAAEAWRNVTLCGDVVTRGVHHASPDNHPKLC